MDAKVHELVSCAEAFRAKREEAALMSDPEGSTVNVAYVQGDRPSKSFAQYQRSATEGSLAKSQGDGKYARVRENTRHGHKRKQPPKYLKVHPDKCAG